MSKPDTPATPLAQALARIYRDGKEVCIMCGTSMGFPAYTTHVDDPLRYKDGADYIEGCGQICAPCNKA